jgi:hypothetical protein
MFEPLPLAEDDLGNSLTKFPVMIDQGDSHVLEGKKTQTLHPLVDGKLPLAQRGEEVFQFGRIHDSRNRKVKRIK